MKLVEIIPDHANRAAGFREGATMLLKRTSGLAEWEVLDETRWTDKMLTGIDALQYLTPEDRTEITRMLYANDVGSADRSAVLVNVAATLKEVLEAVAVNLTDLAESWKAKKPSSNVRDEIGYEDDEIEKGRWVLSIAFVFADLSESEAGD